MKKIFSFGRKKKSGPPSSTSDTGSVLSAGYELRDKDLSKFQRAASCGDVAKIRQLLHKHDINQADKESRTPLHLSCANGHLEVVKLLVENKAKLNVCDNDNRSPLMKAIQCQHETCATVLLEHQADPNIVDVNENAALHLAALIPSMSIAVQLLEHGANINAINKDGCTPLILAVTENHQEMVELLIKEGADINSRDSSGRTSLMIAASNGHISLVKYLLQNNADSSIKDLTGWTADDYAVNDGHHACSQLIFEHSSKNKQNASPYGGPSKKKGTSMFSSQEKGEGRGFTLGSPATDKEGTEDLSQAESESSHRSEEPDSWPTSDEDDLDFSPKKTAKPSLTQLLHTKKNRKDKLETQVRNKSISEGNIDSIKKKDEDEEGQNKDEELQSDDEDCEDDDEQGEEEDEDCEEEEDCEVEENEDEEEEEEQEEEDEDEDDDDDEDEDADRDEISESHRDQGSECDEAVGQDGETCIKDSENEAANVPDGAACTSGCGSVIESDDLDVEMKDNKPQSSYNNEICDLNNEEMSIQDNEDAQTGPDSNEVPVSLIFGLLEEDDEHETSPMQSEVTMLKSCLKSKIQSHKQVTFTNTIEESIKETNQHVQPCTAVELVTNIEDVHDLTQNNTSHYSCDLTEHLDCDTAGVEGIHTRVVGEHDESFSGDEVDDKSANRSVRADKAHMKKIEASGDGIGRKVALMTELGFEDDDVESPWDSESASESPRKQSTSDVAPPSVQTHMQCISEESQEDASDNSSGVKPLEMQKVSLTRVDTKANEGSTSHIFNMTTEKNKPDLMADLGLDDADDIEDASDWDSTSHSFKCSTHSSPRHKQLEISSPHTHGNKITPKDAAASHPAFMRSVPEENIEDDIHSIHNNSQSVPKGLVEEPQNSKTALSNGNQVAKDMNITSVGREKGTSLSKPVESMKSEDGDKKPSLQAGPITQLNASSKASVHKGNNEVERPVSSQADDKLSPRKGKSLVNGSMLDAFDDSSLSEISQEEDGRSSGKLAEKKKKENIADYSESSDTATEDSEMPNSSFKDAMLLIRQLNLDGQDSLKSLKIQNILHEYERLIEKEKGRRALLSREVKKLRKERKELQQILEENRELKFLLEHHKVEWESDLNNLRLTLKQEEEKRKSAEMLYDKSKEQLRKKEDQCCKEMEEKQHLELSLRNVELEMRSLKNNMKQVEEERIEAQRLHAQELNLRMVNEGILNNLKKKNEEEEARKLKSKHEEILNQSSEANEKEKDLILRNVTLQEELSTLKVEMENLRSHYQEDESRYMDENEMLKEKIEDLRKDLKMNEETLTQTVIQYNGQLNALKTETAMMCSKIEHEKHSKERLETELEAIRSRLNSTLQDLERSQASKTETERTLQRERDDWLRSKDKLIHELSNMRESHGTLSQQLSRAESKTNGLENELHRTGLSLQEKTLLYDNAQRDLAQAQSKIRDIEQALQVEKDHNTKNSVKQESIQERLAQITSENMQLRQQLEDVQNKGIIKEKAVSDVQDRFTDIFSKLRADTERQVHIVEERNKDLITKSNELREQIYKLETEKVDRESTIRQLQQELADALKKLSMSEASLEVITRYRNDLEEEKQQLQRELEKFRAKLQDLEDQFVQSERRNHQLKNALDDKERETIAAFQKVQEFSASANGSEKAIKQLEEHIQKLEIENARIEATAKQQAGQMESLQKELLESVSIRNRLEDLVTNLQSTKIGLEEKLNQNVHKQSALSQSAQDNQNLWEAELKSRSQIGLRLAELEGLNANLSDQLTVEKKKLRKLADQKKSVEERFDQEMKRSNKLQHEVAELRKLLKTAKKRLKDYDGTESRSGLKEGSRNYETDSEVLKMKQKIEELSSQMERESRRYMELESANRDLQEEVTTNKKLYRNIEKLERGKRQLEEELAELKRCVDSSKRSQSYLDMYKKEVDERGRQEIRQQLEEVNLFLQAHAASQDKLEQMRAESDASIRTQMEHRIQDLESELHRLKNSQLENTGERDSTKHELNRFKELFAEEQKARKSLTSKLERANERLSEANSKLLNERQRNKSLIASTFLNGSMAASPVVDTSHLARLSSSLPFNRSLGLSGGLLNTVGNSLAANQVESYFTKMQHELEKNIAKELDQANAELEAGDTRISPVGSITGSLRNLNADQESVSRATQQYLEVLKKNYMIN